jgi:hypothetical protein
MIVFARCSVGRSTHLLCSGTMICVGKDLGLRCTVYALTQQVNVDLIRGAPWTVQVQYWFD